MSMIILDTSILMRLLEPQPDAAVAKCIAQQPHTELHTTAIAQAQILHDIALMPQGERMAALQAAAAALFEQDLAGRILPFDGAAATTYAVMEATRRRLGCPSKGKDGLTWAIALEADAMVATRDTSVMNLGVAICDPRHVSAPI